MVKFFQSLVLYIRCKRAIKKAERERAKTGTPQFVVMLGGRPLVISQQRRRELVRKGVLSNKFNNRVARRMAIHKTN
jgi:hypothetical protein